MDLPFTSLKLITNEFNTDSPLTSTAFNTALFDYTNATTGFLHLWITPPAIALGHRDKQLPFFNKATDFLLAHGYIPYVRSAGGLAVISDPNILNGALIFEQPLDSPLSIESTYQLAIKLLKEALSPLPLVVGEIKQSYCPGDFDVSINGLKIAGLAQYRHRNKVLVSFYLSVAGNQLERGQLIRQMYQIGTGKADIMQPYPNVDPACMTTLATLKPQIKVANIIKEFQSIWPNIPKSRLIVTDDINDQVFAIKTKLIARQPANLNILNTKGTFI